MPDASCPDVTRGFAPADALEIAWRAATLPERLSSVLLEGEARRPGQAAAETIAADIAAWAQAVGGGAPVDAFERRLAWDGIDRGAACRALAPSAPATLSAEWPAARWTQWLPRFLRASADCHATLATPAWRQEIDRLASPAEPPFIEAWVPILHAARARLDLGAPRLRTVLAPAAQLALERHLVRTCAAVGAGALYERFLQDRRYDAMIHRLLAGEWAAVFWTYPVLARQLAVLAEQWVDGTVEMVDRLEADREAIEALVGARADSIVAAAPGLSDRHGDGRTVTMLQFSSGLRLAYKPRDVRLEAAFNAFLARLRNEGLDAVPQAVRVLDRGTHGWVEWVEQGAFGSREEVAAYFRRAGGLACVAHLLGAADLHGENVVASLTGPKLVDTEMLLQPDAGIPAAGAADDEEAGRVAPASCLATGLLSLVQVDANGNAYDIGGLQHSPARSAAVGRREWRHLRSDALHVTRDTGVAPVLANDVRLHTVVQPPSAFVADILYGFAETAAFLVGHRVSLISDSGPLAAFADCRVRVLFRPSDQYGALQYLLAAPRYQRRGIDRSIAIETLLRVFAGEEARPRLWPLVADERAALERLDIPRFTLPASATTAVAGNGARIAGCYARSGLDAARARLSTLCHEPGYQVEQLRAALEPVTVAVPTENERRVPHGAESDAFEGLLIRAAEMIGIAVRARAEEADDGRLTWPSCRGALDLYAGASGLCLFFSALAAVTRSEHWGQAARATLSVLAKGIGSRDWQGRERLGACSGLPSVIYALTAIGALTDDESAVERAMEAALSISPFSIDTDPVLDVEGGAAGALLGLLALHARRPDDRVLALAQRCVGRLLASQIRVGGLDGAWAAGDDGRPRPGFAHGAAGIACALERWLAYDDAPALVRSIHRAWEYERRAFAESGGLWPTVRRDGRRIVMTAWCHGAPGLALGRACGGGRAADPRVEAEIEAAVRLTTAAPRTRLDHLCCGNLGRADVLLTVGRVCAREEVAQQGRLAAEQVARRVLAEGRLGMRGHGFERGAADVGFFQGLAGIGYQLLRTAAPGTLPSVLAFETSAGRDR